MLDGKIPNRLRTINHWKGRLSAKIQRVKENLWKIITYNFCYKHIYIFYILKYVNVFLVIII